MSQIRHLSPTLQLIPRSNHDPPSPKLIPTFHYYPSFHPSQPITFSNLNLCNWYLTPIAQPLKWLLPIPFMIWSKVFARKGLSKYLCLSLFGFISSFIPRFSSTPVLKILGFSTNMPSIQLSGLWCSLFSLFGRFLSKQPPDSMFTTSPRCLLCCHFLRKIFPNHTSTT